ncbi:glycosyltransferase [Aequorivita marisscotiae]|uniref:Glycosyltransferase n=1 Tax=Aequorivita marisscotiae TaxID=3040348 RepID=A0ABY8KPH7_9FLAO|nr:glycosyltransferase [Aequorivita sp. Ant34-E75]WGF91366.1 glycosyltransferase [Aequorivita sp. Ant34-E75]
MKKLLIIGHTFPEPSTTAAGSRMMQLLQLFEAEQYEITFASTASVSGHTAKLELRNISVKNILLNDPSFDEFIKNLNPEIVLFDRYISEEQFGWRISENCPNCLKILDTEDLHFLRKAREEAIKANLSVSDANLFSNLAKRELASILRCDLSLIISEYEMELLQNTFKISGEILHYLPFLIESVSEEIQTSSFKERQNFIAIGNLLHAPNVDSVLQLKQIWPEIKKQLPKAELHIYGAYASQQILQLNNKKEGFIIKGWANNLETTLQMYRLQLAPLRFGAGLKGKLLDAMRFGLPSVTTKIGAEAMGGKYPFGGAITDEQTNFITQAIHLYSDENTWQEAQKNGFGIIKNRFRKNLFSKQFMSRINELLARLDAHRQHNFTGQILQHHTLQSTKYLSKWIESKSVIAHNASPVCFANSDEVREDYKQ